MVSFMLWLLYSGERAPDTFNWRLGGCRASHDLVAKRKVPVPTGNQTLILQPIATLLIHLFQLISFQTDLLVNTY